MIDRILIFCYIFVVLCLFNLMHCVLINMPCVLINMPCGEKIYLFYIEILKLKFLTNGVLINFFCFAFLQNNFSFKIHAGYLDSVSVFWTLKQTFWMLFFCVLTLRFPGEGGPGNPVIGQWPLL
jgi:hypothetical protein